MNNALPKVSIITATYNRSHLISETLDSIKNQSFTNWECLIIDDGSIDDTSYIVKSYIKKDTRFKYLQRGSNHKKGLPGCRNKGVKIAKGEFIVFFDDDDIVHPDNLLIATETFRKYNVDYVRYLRKVFTGKFIGNFDNNTSFDTKHLDNQNLEEIITGEIPFNSCQVIWKRKCFINNLFNENLQYAEEWECYARILSEGVKGISIEKVLFYGRKHPASNTGEFWNNDPIRVSSKVEAVKLVIDNLTEKDLLSPGLKKYFLRLGFMFKIPEIINYTLKKSESNPLEVWKFKLGYKLYPVIKPIFNLKKKLKF